MKEYVFEVRIFEGCDEFWELPPTKTQVKEMLIDQIENSGAITIKRKGGYKFAKDTVKLINVLTHL